METYGKGAQEIFGYTPEEVIGKKRISVFSPGEIVLQNVPMWLSETQKNGEYVTETVFVRKDGSRFPARIRITPTFANGKDQGQTGYCGVTEVLDKPVEEVEPEIRFSTKLIKALVITRMPFLSAIIMPVLIGAALASRFFLEAGAFNGWYFALVLLGVALLHLGSNVMNDYFDVKDGTDDLNTGYFQQYSGGSRAIELGLITLEGTKRVGLSLIAAALLIGIYLTYETGWTTFLIGLSGLAIGYFYTAPPVRLVARKGLGELGIALAFGPLITLGTVYVLTQELSWLAFLAGVPSGLLTANILLINEFPDAESDAKTGKNHLVVTFGKKASILIYLGILLGAVGTMAALNLNLPVANLGLWLVAGLTLLAGLYIVQQMRQNVDRRELVKSNVHTITLSALASLALALVIWLV